MMMRAASADRHVSSEAQSAGRRPQSSGGADHKLGQGQAKAHPAASFTPPPRRISRPSQKHSGAKVSAPAAGGRKPGAGTRSKSTGASSAAARRPALGPGGQSPEAAASAAGAPSERATASELQKENSALRALAARLKEKLAAAERRERWYQSTAQELLAAEQGAASGRVESQGGDWVRWYDSHFDGSFHEGDHDLAPLHELADQTRAQEINETASEHGKLLGQCDLFLEDPARRYSPEDFEDHGLKSEERGDAGDAISWAMPPRRLSDMFFP